MQHKKLVVEEMPVGLEMGFPATAGSLLAMGILPVPEGAHSPTAPLDGLNSNRTLGKSKKRNEENAYKFSRAASDRISFYKT